MSLELIAIIVMGLALSGMLLIFDARKERIANRRESQTDRRRSRMDRTDRLEERMNQRMDRMEKLMMQRLDDMDTRLRALERGQAHLAGEVSTLREAIRLRAAVQR